MTSYHHVVCPFCALLCDDLTVEVEDGRVVSSTGCPAARALFPAARAALQPLVAGRPAALGEALSHAAAILTAAQRPLVVLLGHQSSEAAAAAADLARALGGALDGPPDISATLRTMASRGLVSSTLGEVRNRADVVLCWGVDPLTSHPRLLERLVESPGLYRPGGRAGRTLVVVDSRDTPTTRSADLVLVPAAGGAAPFVELLWELRAMVAGRAAPHPPRGEIAGIPWEGLRSLADLLRGAQYGALFYADCLPAEAAPSAAHLAGLASLADELNTVSRWAAFCLPAAPNAWGTAAALAAATGYGHAVSFAADAPLHDGGELSAPALLAAGAVDAVLAIGGPPGGDPPAYLAGAAPTLPIVAVEAQASPLAGRAAVVLPVAAPGIAGAGTMARLDRVALPLRSLTASPWPDDAALLRRLLEEVGAHGV